MNRKGIDCKKIFAKCLSDKRRQLRIYEEFSNSIIGKQTTQFFKWSKDLNQSFTKEDLMAKKSMKRFPALLGKCDLKP